MPVAASHPINTRYNRAGRCLLGICCRRRRLSSSKWNQFVLERVGQRRFETSKRQERPQVSLPDGRRPVPSRWGIEFRGGALAHRPVLFESCAKRVGSRLKKSPRLYRAMPGGDVPTGHRRRTLVGEKGISQKYEVRSRQWQLASSSLSSQNSLASAAVDQGLTALPPQSSDELGARLTEASEESVTLKDPAA